MSAQTTLKPTSERTEPERVALRRLSRAVYPPEDNATWPGNALTWAPSQWDVSVRDAGGRLVSYTGVMLRDGTHDTRPVRIGGIGGVQTHPDARRRGYAAAGIHRAVEFLRDEAGVDFALLVCSDSLRGYYTELGWKEFGGRLLVLQSGETVEFTFNRVMVLPVASRAPLTGTIDLLGPPW